MKYGQRAAQKAAAGLISVYKYKDRLAVPGRNMDAAYCL